jgi:hypothetical protein
MMLSSNKLQPVSRQPPVSSGFFFHQWIPVEVLRVMKHFFAIAMHGYWKNTYLVRVTPIIRDDEMLK